MRKIVGARLLLPMEEVEVEVETGGTATLAASRRVGGRCKEAGEQLVESEPDR